MKSAERHITIILILCPIISFIAVFTLYYLHINSIKSHAMELQNSSSYLFWTLDKEALIGNLEQSVRLSNYHSVYLYHSDGDIFIEVLNPEYKNRNKISELFYPIKVISTPVIWEDKILGRIVINSINTFFNTLIIEIILTILITFLLILNVISKDRSKTIQRTMDKLVEVQKELIESNKQASLGKLVRGLAHEINTPLGNAIMMNSYLLEEIQSFKTESPKDLNRLFPVITESYDHVQKNLNKILLIIRRFKEIEEAINDPVLGQYNLKDIINEILLTHLSDNVYSKDSVIANINGTAIVKSSKTALTSIFKEIIENSLHFGNPSTKEKLYIDIEIDRRDKDIFVSYSDSCPEISDTIHETMFDPFVSGKNFDGSLGMGLHIASYLLQTCFMGSINYERKDGKNCFNIKLRNYKVGKENEA